MVVSKQETCNMPLESSPPTATNTQKLQMLTSEEREALEQILVTHDITIDRLQNRPEEVKRLEMFLYNFPKIVCMDFFPNLQSLNLTHQRITEISGLESCGTLEALWLVENQIQKIQGLDQLTRLKRLYLYSNKIQRIQNLENLTQLEVLWLSDNRISALEGLEALPMLTELNLARNRIHHLPDSISKLSALRTLHLAHNNISSFKEVTKMAQIPCLRDLCFSDPHWGDSPIACLCNYQTYVLFTLPHLTSLDTLMLAEESKQLAEATYIKKKMYYNMRMKTMRRNVRNTIRTAIKGKEAQEEASNELFDELIRHHKEVLRELEESAYYAASLHDQQGVHELRGKLAELSCCIDSMTRKISQTEEEFAASCVMTQHLCEEYVHRMTVELETGGNIRLEDGKPSDLWCSSCIDLINSRFFPDDFSAYGMTNIRPSRVTRIQNRFLRNRFEQRLSTVVDHSDPSCKQSLEYLLFAPPPGSDCDLSQIIEEGFKSATEYAAMGLDTAVCVTNSLSLVEVPRLESQMAGRKGGAECNADNEQEAVAGSSGRVLVVKVLLGRSVQDESYIGWRQAEASKITPERFPEAHSVYRVKASDPKQKLWYVFDHTLLLPEYLVDFDYTPQSNSQATGKCPGPANGDQKQEEVLVHLPADVRPIVRPLMPWLKYHFDPNTVDNSLGDCPFHQRWRAVLETAPAIPDRPKVYMISEEALSKAVHQNPHSNVVYMNLHNNAIRNIESADFRPVFHVPRDRFFMCNGQRLESLRNLRILVLSFNEIQKIDGLGELIHLERLELGYNCIRVIEGLKGLRRMTYLELNNNQIAGLDNINVLRRYVPQLATLDLRNNPVCDNKSYRSTVIRQLETLKTFDGRSLTDSDRKKMSDDACSITQDMILEAVHRPKGWTVNRTPGASSTNCDKGGSLALSACDEWMESVEELVLEHKNIRRLSNLNKLTSLKRLSLSDNEITRIEGLDGCEGLQELCLDDNRIIEISGLDRLGELKKLELGSNLISQLDGLHTLTNLTLLSIEDNQLRHLRGLESLINLMELYAGNNYISELRVIQQFKELPKVIILDLLGNPVCEEEEYRLYVIYNLRKLKVLDGQRIEAAEQASAKSQYAGRLTLEFLEEKMGHRFFDRIRELDISGQRLRDVGHAFQVEFESLHHLTLDSNLITDVSGLTNLSQLTVLSLNGNKIADQCSFKPKIAAKALVECKHNHEQENRGAKNACTSREILTPLATEIFPYLQVLQLGDNQITSIASLELSNLTSLRSLFLHRNEITKVDGVNGLVNLKELVLDGNRIKYIDPMSFAGLSKLQELRMEENGLRSLANLHMLPSLHSLQLGFNRITDVASLDKLSCLTSLVEISLANNPVCRKQVYRAVLLAKCPVLVSIDNKQVTLEEREYVSSLFVPSPTPGSYPVDPSAMAARRYGIPDPQSHGHSSKVPIRMTALNFETFLSPGFAAAHQQAAAHVAVAPVSSLVPSIPCATAATPRFGLEGVAIKEYACQAQSRLLGEGGRGGFKVEDREGSAGFRSTIRDAKVGVWNERRTRAMQRMFY